MTKEVPAHGEQRTTVEMASSSDVCVQTDIDAGVDGMERRSFKMLLLTDISMHTTELEYCNEVGRSGSSGFCFSTPVSEACYQ